jgi:hypothetical protein
LKFKMPRVLPDHRSHEAKRLRHIYADLLARFPKIDGISRRVALMTAEAWRDYENLGLEIARGQKNRRGAMEIARLRRRRQSAAGMFLAGLRNLETLAGGKSDGRGLDIAAALAHQELGGTDG